MTRRSPIFALTLLALTLPAQQSPLARIPPDPANLTGEHTFPQALADTLPINHGAPALQQLLLKLRTRASLMLIVAHPDDEDGGFLTYESRGAGARVAMLTLTRGEGGQNLMSADFGDALGLLRTQELLAADRYLGVDQFFGTEADFGFSKTKEESLEKWTHDRVLYDAVRAVRLYRPLVLASVFVGGPTDGHGHHQVAGEISQEVFLAAADPNIFPEQHLPPWAPLKVYARVPFSRVTAEGMYDYATGRTVPGVFHNYVTKEDSREPPKATVLIHEGDPATAFGAPALGTEGLSYVQFGRKGLALQKTQIGPNVRLAPAGRSDVGYTLMATRRRPAPESEQSIFEGIDTSLGSLAAEAPTAPFPLGPGLADVDFNLAKAQQAFDPDRLELTAPPLRDALRALDALLKQLEPANFDEPNQKFNLLHELLVKRVQLNQALILAHNLSLTAALNEPTEAPLLSTLKSLGATLSLTSQSANSIKIYSSELTVNYAGEGIGQPGPNEPLEPRTTRELRLRLPYLAGLFPTRPYFSRPGIEQPYYDIAVPELRNAPATPAPIVAHVVLDDQGVRIDLAAIVPMPQPPTRPAASAADTGAQEIEPSQPLVVVPPVSVRVTPTAAIFRPADKSLPLTVTLTGPATPGLCARPGVPLEGKLGLVLPETWSAAPASRAYDPPCPTTKQAFTLTSTAPFMAESVLDTQAIARAGNRNYTESFRPVGYPGLTYTNLYTPARYRATAIDVATAPDLRVAYLPGTGDSVPSYLANLGIEATILLPADLTPENLAKFDTVLLGVRAYSAHPDLNSAALRAFAEQGGVVVLQYMSGGFPQDAAPYPISIPGDPAHNVVEEAQPVRVLAPRNPLLTWPNQITPDDFNGWVEERGHGFPSNWDEHYTALIETHDAGQDPQRGGLLVAPVGKGAYVYVALALYRQLPEGVPGAYRLLANLLSYTKNPSR